MNDEQKNLFEQTCVPCQGTESPLGDQKLLLELSDWAVALQDDIPRLKRVYKFKNFAEALEFTNAVGRQAEAQNHHPAILTEWGQVTLEWWTHTVRGLHRNDFILAARCDKIFSAEN